MLDCFKRVFGGTKLTGLAPFPKPCEPGGANLPGRLQADQTQSER
jgi:hypothetical protein